MAKKIKMNKLEKRTIAEVYEDFVLSQTANGLSDVTIRNYRLHLHSISKHLDISTPISELNKRTLERMVVSMKESGLAHNSISSYARVFRTFLNWCDKEGIASVEMPKIKDKESVKETYTDDELSRLLERPKSSATFAEYRNWVIINFLLNSGCRASTIRNIQIQDVDIKGKRVVFRHTKNGKIQMIPLCSIMISILRDYMKTRQGKGDEFLFCDQFGGMLSENALRLAIAKYNQSRGVDKTSIHAFRHTFARKYLIDCGGNAFALQKMLGHSTLKMTKHYCAVYDADIANNFDQYSPLSNMKQHRERIKRA